MNGQDSGIRAKAARFVCDGFQDNDGHPDVETRHTWKEASPEKLAGERGLETNPSDREVNVIL